MATLSKTERDRQARADRKRQRADRKFAQDQAEIDRLISEGGWAVCVADYNDPRDPAPYFAYTIGLTRRGQPELCMWGHERADMPALLNGFALMLEQQKRTLVPGEVLVLPGVGAWEAVRVPPEAFSLLEFAQSRYTFLRAVRLRQVV